MRLAAATGQGAMRCAAVAVALCAVLAGTARADGISVEVTVENDTVVVNQPFFLTIAVKGAQNVSPPALYDLDGFEAGYLGPSTQISFVNGRMSASISHRYRVVPLRVGQFSLGPFAVEAEGQRYETKPIAIKVVDAAGARTRRGQVVAPGGAQGLRLVVEPAKTEVYVGERVDLTLTLYVGNVRIRDLQYPVIAAEGVTLDKFSKPTESNEVVNGQRFHTVSMRTTMTPVQPGTVDLDATMAMNMIAGRGNVDPLFDQFFPGNSRPIDVRAEPTVITVLPLPEQGKPADFTGAVGNFDFRLTAQPTELDAGDPITLRMELSGTGDLSSVTPPTVPVDDRFRTYDAQPVKGEDSPQRRVFEQVVIPQRADVTQLPAVRFSFFDPEARAYRTITQGPTALTVRAARDAKPEVVDANQPAAEAPQEKSPLGRDIVYIKDAPGTWYRREPRFYERAWFALLQLVPVAIFAAAWAYVRRRDRLAGDPRLVRFRQAGREARRALAALNGQVDAGFYDQLSTALAAYLGAKLDLPPGGVERERVLARLDAAACTPQTRQQVGEFFQLVERARYAPSQINAAERDTALALAKSIVDGLEHARNLERRLAAAGAVLMLGAATLLGGAQADEVAPQAGFFQGNQAYAAGNYREAIAAYESVRAAGFDSAGLDFNLGNALFKDGQTARAIASYERALRLAPRDPDVQANLSYARELAQVPDEAPPLWQRLAFPLAPRATGGELAMSAAIAWWALWLLLAARLLVPRLRPPLTRAAWIAGALYLAIAASLGLRLSEVELSDRAIVVAANGAAVRFEPSPTGTEHFPAAPGTALDISEERDGWLQVRRADGRRGWIPSDAVERLR